jgi:hypothetical protein
MYNIVYNLTKCIYFNFTLITIHPVYYPHPYGALCSFFTIYCFTLLFLFIF